jgi:hypothetical protein
MGLPVACNIGCGGNGPITEYKMIGQELSNVEVVSGGPTSDGQLRFAIVYAPEALAAVDFKQTGKFFGAAYACSPPPQIFVNLIDSISITSNKDLYDFKAGDELISLFQRVIFTEMESLTFPIQLDIHEYFQLVMFGPLPDNPEHTFVIQTVTSDNMVFESELSILFQ